jgi:hypothetical protein
MKDKKVNQVLSGGWYQWEGEDIRKGYRRVNIMNSYIKMEKKDLLKLF